MEIIQLSQRFEIIESAPGEGARTITGLAVPWNIDATVSGGKTVRFLPGSLPTTGKAPKLIGFHDMTKPLGLVTSRTETPQGMTFSAKVSNTVAGTEALTLAADGVVDSVSVGVKPIDFTYEGSTMIVAKGDWVELSLVPVGAFSDARVATVAASENPENMIEGANPVNEDTQNEDEGGEGGEVAPIPAPVLAQRTPAAVIAAAAPRTVTAAEYIAARVAGGNEWVSIKAANQITDDSTGILPTPIVGPVYDAIAAMRPLINAVGLRAMPGMGRTFTRPIITQHTAVGQQVDELDVLSSQAQVIDPVTVTKNTYGGYVTLSEQDVDFTDPAALTLVLNDLAAQYAIQTENVACSALVGATGSSESVADWTDPQQVVGAVWAARTAISASGYLPTHIFASSDRVATLGTLSTSDGQPLFPNLNPSSVYGSLSPASSNGQPFGLTLVESYQLPEGTLIVGNPRGLELFEQQKGSIQVNAPDVLGLTIAFRGYFATLAIDETKFVAIVTD